MLAAWGGEEKRIFVYLMMMFENKAILSNIDEINTMLRATKRDGIECVIQYMEESGFYEVPSSLYRHHNWRGGLAEHCLGVYKMAVTLDKEWNTNLPQDSLVIAGILHDVCKATKLYYDADGIIRHRHTNIKGHGRRSIKILERCGLSLTEDERLAIRWHMGGHHASIEEQDEVARARQNPLWKVIHKADQLDAGGRTNMKVQNSLTVAPGTY